MEIRHFQFQVSYQQTDEPRIGWLQTHALRLQMVRTSLGNQLFSAWQWGHDAQKLLLMLGRVLLPLWPINACFISLYILYTRKQHA